MSHIPKNGDLKYGDDPNLLHWLEANPDMARKLVKNKYISRAIAYVVEVGCHKFEDLLATFSKLSKELVTTQERRYATRKLCYSEKSAL